MGTVDWIQSLFLVLCAGLSGWALVTRRRISGVSPRPSDPVHALLEDLLAKSRSAGGRVHIHDVEEAVHRHLG
jgi:hypothetical protein